jgi:hypothetical protein
MENNENRGIKGDPRGGSHSGSKEEKMPKNNMVFWSILCAVVALIGLGLLTTGIALNDMDTMWMVFVGFFLFVTFVICTLLFWKQARLLHQMFKGKNLLAHWIYSKEKAVLHAEGEKSRRGKMNLVLWLIIAGFVVFFSLLFVLFGKMDEEETLLFLSIMGGVLLICGIAAWFAPIIAERKMKRSVPEVFVGETAAWAFGEFDIWKSAMTRFKNASLKHIESPEEEIFGAGAARKIEIVYEQMQRYGYQERTVLIPVPVGKEKEAEEVVRRILEANSAGL